MGLISWLTNSDLYSGMPQPVIVYCVCSYLVKRVPKLQFLPCRPVPIMLEILPIILLRISQNFHLLFFCAYPIIPKIILK